MIRGNASTRAAAGAGLLVAVFVVAKFNPIHIDGLAMTAVLLGLLDTRGARLRGLPSAALTLSAAGVLASAWLLIADRRCFEGMRTQTEGRIEEARAAYAAAVRMNPTESRYGFWLVGLIRDQARTEKDPARRIALGLEAVAAARAREEWHPLDVRAPHALGGARGARAGAARQHVAPRLDQERGRGWASVTNRTRPTITPPWTRAKADTGLWNVYLPTPEQRHLA